MIWLAAPAVAAACYYILALIAAFQWRGGRVRKAVRANLPAVSILKPVHGRDPRFYEAIVSHARQEYPAFEILFGVSDPCDPALADVARLRSEYPDVPISVYLAETKAPNAKVGVLAELAKHAQHPVLLVNDSDIVVEPGYLESVTAPLDDQSVGLVTCLYRATAGSAASKAEALGIATEFAPSVLVARLLGVAEFALGCTMAFRAETLRQIGGFESISGFLADDYHLGASITGLGKRVVFAPIVVETDLGSETWAQTWRHQLRWSRTIRVSRQAGYYGYGVTHASFWAIVALAGGQWWAGAAALAVRIAAGLVVGGGILRDRNVILNFWQIPLRDLFGFGVWLGGCFGESVDWRGRRLLLNRDGRICEKS